MLLSVKIAEELAGNRFLICWDSDRLDRGGDDIVLMNAEKLQLPQKPFCGDRRNINRSTALYLPLRIGLSLSYQQLAFDVPF